MRAAASEIRINMPIADVWARLRDLTLAANYVPSVKSVRMDTDAAEGVGASRTVFLNDGSDMQETVEEWTDGGGFLLRLHKGDKPAMPIFSAFQFRYEIEDDGAGATIFRPALLYKTRFGPIGWAIGKLAHEKMVQSAHEVGVGLKQYYESGEPVSDEKWKELRAQMKG